MPIDLGVTEFVNDESFIQPLFSKIGFALPKFVKLKLWFQMYSNDKHGNFSNCSTMAVILFFVLFFAPRWQVDVCCCLFSCGNLTEKTNRKIKRRCYHYNYPLRVNNWVWNSGILAVTKILFCFVARSPRKLVQLK